MVERYLGEPPAIPPAVRTRIEKALGGRPIQLYAPADLDASLRLHRSWVALGETAVAIADEAGGEVRVIAREAIRRLRTERGLSASTMRLLGGEGETPLAELRFTHRQRDLMGNIEFVLARGIGGEATAVPDDDDGVYLDGLSGPIARAQATVAGDEMSVVWRLLGYLKPYAPQVALGMAAAVLLALASLAPPYLTGKLVDEIVGPFQAGTESHGQAWAAAALLLVIITAAFLLRLLFLWVRLHVMAILGEYVAHDMRREVYDRVQSLSVRYFSKHQTGSILSRVGADTDRIWEFMAYGVVEVSLSLITLLSLSVVLVMMDWRLGIVMVAPVPLMVWAIIANGRNMQGHYTRAWRKWAGLNDVLADTIPGIRVVKAFHQEDRERRRFGERNRDMLETFNQVHASWTRFWPLLMLAIHGISIAIYWMALPRLLSEPAHPAHLSVGTLIAFLLFMGMFFQPIESFGQMSRMLNKALSSARRVFDMIDTQSDMPEGKRAPALGPLRGEIEFRDVHFGYDEVRPVLQGVTFRIEPGETIGVVGASGAGKTTLVNLIARFYDPRTGGGSVLIDGEDLREIEIGAVRRQIGLVEQDPFLFYGTILENIRYGEPEAGLDRVIEAARGADAHGFICRLPQAYDTVVGERGHTLSGGERQRVAIARALLGRPRILILDEAMSNVDSETEHRIQKVLDAEKGERTTLAIAHRLSTLKSADRILVLAEGRVVEMGTPRELLAREDGEFRRLSDLQKEERGEE